MGMILGIFPTDIDSGPLGGYDDSGFTTLVETLGLDSSLTVRDSLNKYISDPEM